jgi:hypothetical protein
MDTGLLSQGLNNVTFPNPCALSLCSSGNMVAVC